MKIETRKIKDVENNENLKLIINKLEASIIKMVKEKPTIHVTGSFNSYNFIKDLFKENTNEIVIKSMDNLIDNVVITSICYDIDFYCEIEIYNNLDFILIVMDNDIYLFSLDVEVGWLFDFDDEKGCMTKLHDEFVNMFSSDIDIRSYHITTNNELDVLELTNLKTGFYTTLVPEYLRKTLGDVAAPLLTYKRYV